MRGPEFFSEIEVETRGASLAEALLLALMGAMPSQSWFSLREPDGEPVTGGNLGGNQSAKWHSGFGTTPFPR